MFLLLILILTLITIIDIAIEKLIKRNCLKKLINIFMGWNSHSCTTVKWGMLDQSPSHLQLEFSRVVMAPELFSIFVNDLLLDLVNSKLVCHVKHMPFNVFMYADDIIILSSSTVKLQKLVNISTEKLSNLGMIVNRGKRVCTRVGPTYNLEVFGIVID